MSPAKPTLDPTPEAMAAAYEIFYGRAARPDEIALPPTSQFQRYLLDPVIARAHIIDRHIPQVPDRFRRAS